MNNSIKRIVAIGTAVVLMAGMCISTTVNALDTSPDIDEVVNNSSLTNNDDYSETLGNPLISIDAENGISVNDTAVYEVPVTKKSTVPQTRSSSSGGEVTWFYDTGTKLPQKANYSKYDLLWIIHRGDIIYESNGGGGITGHIAIVEGVFWDTTYKQRYIRVIEAIDKGVKRGVLDDERYDYKNVTILRAKDATQEKRLAAINFCVSQLGKSYGLDFGKDTSKDEKDWYCSELVWAAYKKQGIDIETTGIWNEPGITPHDIYNSSKVTKISKYK